MQVHTNLFNEKYISIEVYIQNYRDQRPMGKYRKRFNEKARSGMLAKQAALRKVRNKQFNRPTEEAINGDEPAAANVDPTKLFNEENSNSEILKPMTDEEKLERKRTLEATLYAENQKESKMSRSKRKRLDKYIDHQLKREEKKDLLEKLSKTKIDTSILTASKNLGRGKLTKREDMIEASFRTRKARKSRRMDKGCTLRNKGS